MYICRKSLPAKRYRPAMGLGNSSMVSDSIFTSPRFFTAIYPISLLGKHSIEVETKPSWSSNSQGNPEKNVWKCEQI
jgi:hypothetical protein